MINLIKRDLRSIFSKSKKSLLLYLLLLIMLQVLFIVEKYKTIEVFLEFIADQGYIYSLSGFIPPIAWLLFQLIPTVIFSLALYKDHVENASYMVLKSGSKFKYFISKILVSMILIFALNLFLYAIIAVNLFLSKELNAENLSIINRIVGSYFISQFLLLVIAYMISIKFGYKFALSVNLMALIISMTTNNKWIIGQQTLAFKQDILGGYLTIKDSIVVWLVYAFGLLVAGYLIFRTYNFYGGEND